MQTIRWAWVKKPERRCAEKRAALPVPDLEPTYNLQRIFAVFAPGWHAQLGPCAFSVLLAWRLPRLRAWRPLSHSLGRSTLSIKPSLSSSKNSGRLRSLIKVVRRDGGPEKSGMAFARRTNHSFLGTGEQDHIKWTLTNTVCNSFTIGSGTILMAPSSGVGVSMCVFVDTGRGEPATLGIRIRMQREHRTPLHWRLVHQSWPRGPRNADVIGWCRCTDVGDDDVANVGRCVRIQPSLLQQCVCL